jgi:glycosyltransferase involved in cell wall biosynthesis
MTSAEPLVTVGLPTYNRAQLLPRAIASVLAQSYQRVELVISDNASTDETESICREAMRQDGRIQYVRQPTNCGPIENFTEVVRRSSGELFMWLSDDDWLDAEYLSTCVALLTANQDVSAVCGRVRYVNHDTTAFFEDPVAILDSVPANRVLHYFRTVVRNGVFHSLMRRADAVSIPLENRFGSDWLFMGGMACLGKIRTSPDVCVHRSLGGASGSIKSLVDTLDLPKSAETHPWTKLGLTIALDIIWRNKAYRGLTMVGRLWLGIRAADAIWIRLPGPDWWWHYRSIRHRLDARLAGLSGNSHS